MACAIHVRIEDFRYPPLSKFSFVNLSFLSSKCSVKVVYFSCVLLLTFPCSQISSRARNITQLSAENCRSTPMLIVTTLCLSASWYRYQTSSDFLPCSALPILYLLYPRDLPLYQSIFPLSFNVSPFQIQCFHACFFSRGVLHLIYIHPIIDRTPKNAPFPIFSSEFSLLMAPPMHLSPFSKSQVT